MARAGIGGAVPRLSYAAALAELQRRGRFGIRLGLGRTRALLRAMGNPHLGVRGVLIAGTNGKGSVLALVAAALREAGLRVGETPKPHLVSYRERLQVNGQPIRPDAFATLVADALPLADRVARRYGDPTEFELLTALAFRWFADQAIDVAVVEVGLGGRLDATHAWDGGVAVVTNVALDHMDRLGSTIAAIAREKAAIIERGDLAVTGADGEGLTVIRRRARRVGSPLRVVQPAPLLGWDRDGLIVDLPRLGATRIGLRGRHQAHNAAIAHATLDALAEAGIAAVPDAARRAGFAGARWPGRLELLEVPAPDEGRADEGRADGTAAGGDRTRATPRRTVDRTAGGPQGEVLLDGAHNPAGAAALARALDDLRPFLAGGRDPSPPPVTLLMAMMSDKDVGATVSALGASQVLRGARVVATQVEGGRALPAAQLARLWRDAGTAATVTAEPSVARALARALRDAPGPVVVAGSLYLVGEVRRRLVDDPRLRDPEAD